jgi:hypothetical protein
MARSRQKSPSLVTRFLAFVGAVALSVTPPAISLAEPAPPAAMPMPMPVFAAPFPVSHPAPARAPVRPAAQPNRSAAQSRGDFTVPFDVNVRPRPLPETLGDPALKAAQESIPYRYNWQGWEGGWNPGLFLSPVPCPASTGFWGPLGTLTTPSDALASTGVTLGSLTDSQSRSVLSSAPSYPLYGTGAPAATSAPLLQYGYQPVPCGSSYFFGL